MTYNAIQGLSMVVWIVFYIFYGKHIGLSKPKAFLAAVYTCVTTFLMIFILTWIESGFKQFGAQNAVRVFAVEIIIIYTQKFIFGIDFRKNLDYCSVWPCLWYGVGHLACLIPKCCHSFTYVEGSALYKISYALTGTALFPQQLCEAVCALIIALVMWIIMRKKNYYIGGRMFFVMLITYGVQRIFWEFFRDNNKVIIFKEFASAISTETDKAYIGISNLALWSLAMVVEGVIALIILNKLDKKAALKEATEEE